VCSRVRPLMCPRSFYHKVDAKRSLLSSIAVMRVQENEATHMLFKVCGATLISRGSTSEVRTNTFHAVNSNSPYVLFSKCHSLHPARSDIDWKCRIELAPFRSLHEFLLVNQKVLWFSMLKPDTTEGGNNSSKDNAQSVPRQSIHAQAQAALSRGGATHQGRRGPL
jgi:hypothetical protein